MLREDAHSREWKYVANATALGARISQAKFYVSIIEIVQNVEKRRCQNRYHSKSTQKTLDKNSMYNVT